MTTIDTCLFCDAPAGSGEHVFPAALGGRRVDNGILCSDCNQRFSRRLDPAVARGLAEVLRIIGIRPDRRNEPPLALGHDRRLRRTYRRNAQGEIDCQTREARLERIGDGGRLLLVGDQEFLKRTAVEWQRLLAKRGEQADLRSEPGLIVDLRHRVSYGGGHFARAVARIALNHYATAFPKLARAPSLAPLKSYILTGRGREKRLVWHDLDTREDWLPHPTSPFTHTVTVSLRPDLRRVLARVVLFGGLPWAVDLGEYEDPVLAVVPIRVNLDSQPAAG